MSNGGKWPKTKKQHLDLSSEIELKFLGHIMREAFLEIITLTVRSAIKEKLGRNYLTRLRKCLTEQVLREKAKIQNLLRAAKDRIFWRINIL